MYLCNNPSRIPKRPTRVKFSPSGVAVIVSDAFGDVYKLDARVEQQQQDGLKQTDPNSNPDPAAKSAGGNTPSVKTGEYTSDNGTKPSDNNNVPTEATNEDDDKEDDDDDDDDKDDDDERCILGHLSTITELTVHGGHVVTCDRDARVRVSRWPDAYVIDAFCLGHNDVVTSCSFGPQKKTIVTGSLDGTLRWWDMSRGGGGAPIRTGRAGGPVGTVVAIDGRQGRYANKINSNEDKHREDNMADDDKDMVDVKSENDDSDDVVLLCTVIGHDQVYCFYRSGWLSGGAQSTVVTTSSTTSSTSSTTAANAVVETDEGETAAAGTGGGTNKRDSDVDDDNKDSADDSEPTKKNKNQVDDCGAAASTPATVAAPVMVTCVPGEAIQSMAFDAATYCAWLTSSSSSSSSLRSSSSVKSLPQQQQQQEVTLYFFAASACIAGQTETQLHCESVSVALCGDDETAVVEQGQGGDNCGKAVKAPTPVTTRYDWLMGQRKKKMVHDWKGKKRRHSEVV